MIFNDTPRQYIDDFRALSVCDTGAVLDVLCVFKPSATSCSIILSMNFCGDNKFSIPIRQLAKAFEFSKASTTGKRWLDNDALMKIKIT